jgi:hypothetical protein
LNQLDVVGARSPALAQTMGFFIDYAQLFSNPVSDTEIFNMSALGPEVDIEMRQSEVR